LQRGSQSHHGLSAHDPRIHDGNRSTALSQNSGPFHDAADNPTLLKNLVVNPIPEDFGDMELRWTCSWNTKFVIISSLTFFYSMISGFPSAYDLLRWVESTTNDGIVVLLAHNGNRFDHKILKHHRLGTGLTSDPSSVSSSSSIKSFHSLAIDSLSK